jgi:hypothetical protein
VPSLHRSSRAHVADYVASAAQRGADAGVAGAVLTSGFDDLSSEVSVWKVYYGDDVATYAERSSLPGLVATDVPLLVNDAELDPDMFREETDKLVAARAAAGKPIERVRLAGHSHRARTSSLVMIFYRDASPQTALVQHAANLGHLPRRRVQREGLVEIVVCFAEPSAQVVGVGSIAVCTPIFALDLERLGAIVDGDGGLALGGMRCA